MGKPIFPSRVSVLIIIVIIVMAIFLTIFFFQYGMEEGRKAGVESVEKRQ
ncbi:MAG: hypothetical protein ABI687_04825 [Flavitalea sp.]